MLPLALLNYARLPNGELPPDAQLAWDFGWLTVHRATLARRRRCPDKHSERCIPLLEKASHSAMRTQSKKAYETLEQRFDLLSFGDKRIWTRRATVIQFAEAR